MQTDLQEGVMVNEGVWVNKVMMLTGYAWWIERYALDENQAREAQEAARKAKRRLWAEPMAVAPWEWRKGVRKL
jgi:endonuclease YncB( thermonuclease family)